MKIRNYRIVTQESGFTIIEVLIASTVFVVSFTVMVTLLDTTINRFSNEDLAVGTNIAEAFMMTSLALQETTTIDTILTVGGVSYSVSKKAIITDDLAKVTITVHREKTKRKIIELYNEFLLPKKQ